MIHGRFKGWSSVAQKLHALASLDDTSIELNSGQRGSLRAISERLPNNGVLIADEVGLGKTRIACAVAKSVIEAGGRVAIVVPPTLGYQWRDELQKKAGVPDVPPLLRSLHGYLDAWKEESSATQPWGQHSVVLLSHAFCNWSIRSTTKKNWRWALLPGTLGFASTKLGARERLPRGFFSSGRVDDTRIQRASQWIADNGCRDTLSQLVLDQDLNRWGENSDLLTPESYAKDSSYRKKLECVVGLGLGKFDLIIIDEAHKSRGEVSNLERLLKNVLQVSSSSRRVALTATPIELDSGQWESTLARIGLDVAEDTSDRLAQMVVTVDEYAEAVKLIRSAPTDEEALTRFKAASIQFKNLLSPYLLRRDKREDEWIKSFASLPGQDAYSYRLQQPIEIALATLSPEWQQAVCAAEALSFVTRGKDDSSAKRVRLTIGNGHGLVTTIDQSWKSSDDDAVEAPTSPDTGSELQDFASDRCGKKALRAAWWKHVLQGVQVQGSQGEIGGELTTLYDHPAILAAVAAIEDVVTRRAEKVLVFGRFTKPMEALVKLLNARAMIKALRKGESWPQESLDKDGSINAALRQLHETWSVEEVAMQLKEGYLKLENARAAFRATLLEQLQSEFVDKTSRDLVHRLVYELSCHQINEPTADPAGQPLPVIARALQEYLGSDWVVASPEQLAEAFAAIVQAVSDPAELDQDDAEEPYVEDIVDSLTKFTERLKEEFGRQQGAFARLMNGNTPPYTRRMTQLGFNRVPSNPKVLVVQSVVGREGLNLHLACRTVVLLHPEWNPGVVEQQIGRVDRLGSLWQQLFKDWLAANAPPGGTPQGDPPRIQIHPVIFQGTYDQENWRILGERWDNLRAQLHGVVIHPSYDDLDNDGIADRVNSLAPNFSPVFI